MTIEEALFLCGHFPHRFSSSLNSLFPCNEPHLHSTKAGIAFALSLPLIVWTRKNAELPTPLIRERSGHSHTQLFIDCLLWRSDGDLDNIDEEGEVYFNEVTYSLAAAVVQHTCSTAVSPQQTGGLN